MARVFGRSSCEWPTTASGTCHDRRTAHCSDAYSGYPLRPLVMNHGEAFNDEDVRSLIEGCMRYIHASRLPTPLPTNPAENEQWQEKVLAKRKIDEDAEDAWFELDRLVAKDRILVGQYSLGLLHTAATK